MSQSPLGNKLLEISGDKDEESDDDDGVEEDDGFDSDIGITIHPHVEESEDDEEKKKIEGPNGKDKNSFETHV